jgi:DNA-binding YbaB/EbfC family protein
MFKEIGQLAKLMGNMGRIKEEMERFQTALPQITAEGDAGAGMVRVRVNGKMEVLSCRLSDEALHGNDREMLEDLIKSATNQALDKVRQQVAEESKKMAANLGLPGGLPPGIGLPGLG